MPGWQGKKTGLTWGSKPKKRDIGMATSATAPNGDATIQLTDIIGERVVTVQASVYMDGMVHKAMQDISFGNGPLSLFCTPSAELTWVEAYQHCNGIPLNFFSKGRIGYSKHFSWIEKLLQVGEQKILCLVPTRHWEISPTYICAP